MTLIGGRPVETIRAQGSADPARPGFLDAEIAPGRGMLLLQARLRLPDGRETELLTCPPLAELPDILDGGDDDFAGNKSFSLGAAVLFPYANRIRGRPVDPGRLIETPALGEDVRLPRNWGGKAEGAEQYAMHGLMLAMAPDALERTPDAVSAVFDAGDFGGHWLSRAEVRIGYRLEPEALTLEVWTRNLGQALLPVGVGWHPYFALPSGRRAQARLKLPASARLEVNDYDEVLPTGRRLPVEGTPQDFRGGAALGELYMDDCFVGLEKTAAGHTVCEITDPAAGYGLRIRATSPEVSAIQVYAPPDKPFLVLEPQFNWPDPYGDVWQGQDTGMAVVLPGASVTYEVRLEPFAL